MDARAILAGPGAARTLRAGGTGRLEIALGAGGYVRLGSDGWLLVTAPRAPMGPLSLLVAGLGGERAQAGWPARVAGEQLVLGPHRVALAGLPSRPAGDTLVLPPHGAALNSGRPRGIGLTGSAPAGSPATSAVPGGLPFPAPILPTARPAIAAALAVSPAPPAGLAGGLSALARGELDLAVSLLAGRGDGLTPAGDDVLAGYAGWLYGEASPVALAPLAAGRSSPIGLAYLRCAERGELPAPAVALWSALRSGDRVAAARRARALQTWGSSSGPALLWGMAAAAARDEPPPSVDRQRLRPRRRLARGGAR